ncbi:MAG TPA: MXAN_6640 family putative metalloprotease [Solirubrobacterales bacterium]|nr:MXAN_6640 family putative metalloprotease [Solirubrobacterales bacterium]
MRLLAIGMVALAGALAPATAAASPAASFVRPRPRPTAVLERPGAGITPSRSSYTVPEAPDSPACDANFCVHWVDEGLDAPSLKDSDGNGVPDYVERVLAVAEHVHHVENEKLGWQEPLSDGTLGGGHGKTDIYLSEIGGELFGYAAPDTGQDVDGREPRRLHGYLVLDNDYSPFEFPHTEPGHDLKVTLAHEYNHILQFGYDAYEDTWFAESTAVWMEDQVYNGIDDYLRYVDRWVRLWSIPMTQSSIKEYGSAVWNEWLAHHYGRAIVREAWAGVDRARPDGFAVAAYERAIRAAGPSTFGRDFTRFAADVAEWRTGLGFRESYLYPDMPRQGRLALGPHGETRHLNHTTFSLIRVRARGGRAVEVHLEAPEGVAAGLALVGRVGSERHGRTVKSIAYSAAGGGMTATLPDPGRFQRITAVLVNADADEDGYSARHLDWRYLANGMPFRVSGRIVRSAAAAAG